MQPCIHSFSCSFSRSIISFNVSFIRSFNHTSVSSLVSLIPSSLISFVPSLLHGFIHPCIHLFRHRTKRARRCSLIRVFCLWGALGCSGRCGPEPTPVQHGSYHKWGWHCKSHRHTFRLRAQPSTCGLRKAERPYVPPLSLRRAKTGGLQRGTSGRTAESVHASHQNRECLQFQFCTLNLTQNTYVLDAWNDFREVVCAGAEVVGTLTTRFFPNGMIFATTHIEILGSTNTFGRVCRNE